jgi:hypothetical protein
VLNDWFFFKLAFESRTSNGSDSLEPSASRQRSSVQRLLPAEPTHRTCDLHQIAVIQSLVMKVYGLQAAVPRLDCRNRPEADI